MVCVSVCVCVPYNFSCSSNLLFSCEREEVGERGGWSKLGGLGACQRGRVRQLATKSSLNWKFRLTKAAPGGKGDGGRVLRSGGSRRGEEGGSEGVRLRHDNCSMRAVCALCKFPSLVEFTLCVLFVCVCTRFSQCPFNFTVSWLLKRQLARKGKQRRQGREGEGREGAGVACHRQCAKF